MLKGNPISAAQCLVKGTDVILQPGMRRFIVVPLLVNILVFVLLTFWLVHLYGDLLDQLVTWLPDWLAFLAWILWIVFVLLLLVVYGYSFNLITNLIAAPFYGILAEKVATHITGNAPSEEPLGKLIVRTLGRELLKLWYFVSRGLLVLMLIVVVFFIPVIGGFAVLAISALWSAWSMAVQYTDYAADNQQVKFQVMRAQLRTRTVSSLSLGGLIMLGSMVPVVNIFMMPIAVAGATVYWHTSEKHSAAVSVNNRIAR